MEEGNRVWCVDSAHSPWTETGLRLLHPRRRVLRRQAPLPRRCPNGPFAHAQSEIRDELTSQTLAAIDALRLNYKREVLRDVDYWWLDDAG